MKKKIIETIDCTPDWRPIVRTFLQWIKDASKYEKQYREDCPDYDGAMEAYTAVILDCASKLDNLNKVLKVKDAYIKQLVQKESEVA